MDLIKIGKFIAELRKEQGLSQTQLGEKIGVTNKTVSRWETGTYLPPADMLLVLSEMFGVSINEMLCGKRLKDEEYKAAAEENLRFYTQSVFTVKERLEFFKKKWLKEHIAIMCCLGAVIIGLFLTGLILKQYFLTASSVLLFAVCLLDYRARSTLLLRRQRVHTDMRLGAPFTTTRTFCVFGAQVRRVLRLEWLTLLP